MERRKYGENPTLETRADAEASVQKEVRYKQIIEVLSEASEPMTAKEIAVELCKLGKIPTSERNFTAPRLTELSKIGVVEPVGKKTCKYTKKTVAAYELI